MSKGSATRQLLSLLLSALLLVSPGADLFGKHCVGCHVNGGNIIRRGQNLQLKALARNGIFDAAGIAAIATEGKGLMGGYGEVLGADGADAVSRWVWEQAELGWPRNGGPA